MRAVLILTIARCGCSAKQQTRRPLDGFWRARSDLAHVEAFHSDVFTHIEDCQR